VPAGDAPQGVPDAVEVLLAQYLCQIWGCLLSLSPPRLSGVGAIQLPVAGPTPFLREFFRTTAVWHTWYRPSGRTTRFH
jgi:hypothetical protein